MKTEHTPGPWYSKKVANTMLIGTNGSMGFMTIATSDIVGYNKKELKQYSDESLANAHLIAAAPDLLEALIPFSEMKGRSMTELNSMMAKAKAAINKANGL